MNRSFRLAIMAHMYVIGITFQHNQASVVGLLDLLIDEGIEMICDFEMQVRGCGSAC